MWTKRDENGNVLFLCHAWRDHEHEPTLQLGWPDDEGNMSPMAFSGKFVSVIYDELKGIFEE